MIAWYCALSAARACSIATPGRSLANRYSEYRRTVVPAAPARLHRLPQGDRDEHARLAPERRAVEPARRDADDRQRLAVDDHRLVEHGRIGGELRRPVGVAEHDDRRLADEAIVVAVEEPPERRLLLQHLEVVARDHEALRVLRLALERKVGAEEQMRRDAREDRLDLLQIAEHGVAEDRVAVARLAARLRSRLGPGRREIDQPAGLRHRHRLEQHLVETGENGRVGANPERERDDRDRRHERRLEQHAEGELHAGEAQQVAHGDLDEPRYRLVYRMGARLTPRAWRGSAWDRGARRCRRGCW